MLDEVNNQSHSFCSNDGDNKTMPIKFNDQIHQE